MRMLKAMLAGFSLMACTHATQFAQAAEFPTKPVRMIVPTGAGGGLDAVARMVAQKLAELWGQAVFVENRVGAGGTIGTDALAKAAPDGYTIGMVATSFVSNASVYAKLPYDSLGDFSPISTVSFSPLVLVVNPTLPVRSVNDLVALAKEKPGKLNFASTGVGGGVHLSIEMFRDASKIDVVHVPYKGTLAAVTDVIGGVVDFTVTGLPVALPMVSAGKLRAIAIVGKERSPVAPEVPTVNESLPGYAYNNWIGLLAPVNTPKNIMDKLHASIEQVVNSEAMRKTLTAQGDVPKTMSSADFSSLIKSEIEGYRTLVKTIGVSIN